MWNQFCPVPKLCLLFQLWWILLIITNWSVSLCYTVGFNQELIDHMGKLRYTQLTEVWYSHIFLILVVTLWLYSRMPCLLDTCQSIRMMRVAYHDYMDNFSNHWGKNSLHFIYVVFIYCNVSVTLRLFWMF